MKELSCRGAIVVNVNRNRDQLTDLRSLLEVHVYLLYIIEIEGSVWISQKSAESILLLVVLGSHLEKSFCPRKEYQHPHFGLRVRMKFEHLMKKVDRSTMLKIKLL